MNACPHCGGTAARGTCPLAVACPDCVAGPGVRCRRPSGHPAGSTHAARYRLTERADGAACPGLAPVDTPHGPGCAHCSGLPGDHTGAASTPAPRPVQTLLPGLNYGGD